MKIAFFSTKPYDKTWFEPLGKEYGFDIQFIELSEHFVSAVTHSVEDNRLAGIF